MARLREYFPLAQLTTDLMVGFPGETEENFLETVELVRRARFLDAHVFAYSKRERTPAASFEGQIPEEVKKERSARLMEVVASVRDGILTDIVERREVLSCILETYSSGSYTAHSDGFVEVCVEAETGLEGKMVKVAPVSHKKGIIYGKLI